MLGDHTAGVASAATARTASASHAQAPASAPLVAHVHDARTGEVDLFTGEEHVRVHNPALAHALARAATTSRLTISTEAISTEMISHGECPRCGRNAVRAPQSGPGLPARSPDGGALCRLSSTARCLFQLLRPLVIPLPQRYVR